MLSESGRVEHGLDAASERKVADGDHAAADRTLKHGRRKGEKDRQAESCTSLGCVKGTNLGREIVLARVPVTHERARLGDKVLLGDLETLAKRCRRGLVEETSGPCARGIGGLYAIKAR